jgi:hypothetical protein
VADIISFGSDKPPWRPSRRLIVLGAVLAAVLGAGVVTAAVVRHPGKPAPAASMAAPVPSCPPASSTAAPVTDPAALIIGCAAGGSGLDRRDRGADREGPWTVVVRRVGGSLGRHGAVVTFPVDAPPAAARRVEVGRAAGRAGASSVIWPIGGAYARIRGDLTEAELVAIATDTTVVAGRPATNPPAGYEVAGGGPYRSPSVHEMRYASADLGEIEALSGGLTFTDVARGGGLEDQLYAMPASDGGPVDGRPSVLTAAFGGNGALAWEPAPGVVAYVGYSGGQLTGQAAAALRRLAERCRALSDDQWRALQPAVADQTNGPG